MTTSTKKIDFRSLCYGVDKDMDAPEPAYIFPGKIFFTPMKRNRVSHSERAKEKESR